MTARQFDCPQCGVCTQSDPDSICCPSCGNYIPPEQVSAGASGWANVPRTISDGDSIDAVFLILEDWLIEDLSVAEAYAKIVEALAAPVSAPGVEREAVTSVAALAEGDVSPIRAAMARIIDPLTWAKIDKVMAGGLDGLIPDGWSREQYATSCYYEERRDSFAKADQIIALPLPRMGEGHSPSVENGRALTSEEATMLDRAHMRGVKVIGEIDAPPFIEWMADREPPARLVVDVKYRNGEIDPDVNSDDIDWSHSRFDDPGYDIIAYRIIPADSSGEG